MKNKFSNYLLLTIFVIAVSLYNPVDVYSDKFSVFYQEINPSDATFSNDGAKMFVVGTISNSVHEYSLSDPFNITSSAFTASFDTGTQDNDPTGVTFSNDGAKMFVVGTQNDNVVEYSLSDPFNITSSVFTTSFDIGAQDNTPTGVTFSNDGAKMFVVGSVNSGVYEYSLSGPFNITSSVFTASFDTGTQVTLPAGIAFSNDGTRMFVIGLNAVHEYSLSAPFNIINPTFTDSFSIIDVISLPIPSGVTFSNDGTIMFITESNSFSVYSYVLPAPFDFVDTAPPVITLNGVNPQTIEFGDGYTELGATTNDGSTVTINNAEFIDAVGTYSIYYDSTDASGNDATQVIRTVNVVDTTLGSSINLLNNPYYLSSWDIVTNGGDGWLDISSGKTNWVTSEQTFATSYKWAEKSQTVPITSTDGRLILTEDYSKTYCGEKTGSHQNTPPYDRYYLAMILLDSSGNEIDVHATGQIKMKDSCAWNRNWHTAEVVVHPIPSNTVAVKVKHGGISGEYWDGWYGPAMKDIKLVYVE